MQVTVIELIRQLQKTHDTYGDLPVIVYTNSPEAEFSDIDVEFNDDSGDPVIMISV